MAYSKKRKTRRGFKPTFATKRRKAKRTSRRALITPKTKIVKLSFVFTTQLDAATGTVVHDTVSANNLFKPLDGETKQPGGFDQWMAFYKNFTVVDSSVKWEVLPSTVSSHADQQLMILSYADFNDNGGSSVSASHFLPKRMQAGVSHATISSVAGGGPRHGVHVLRNNFNLRRDFGHYRQTENEGTTAVGPTEKWYYHIAIHNPWSAANPGAVNITGTVTYTVLFQERRTTIYDS